MNNLYVMIYLLFGIYIFAKDSTDERYIEIFEKNKLIRITQIFVYIIGVPLIVIIAKIYVFFRQIKFGIKQIIKITKGVK